MAAEAPFTIPAKMDQPGSRRKSQCERLLGSFQSLIEVINRTLGGEAWRNEECW
jgi:hypothetical protein